MRASWILLDVKFVGGDLRKGWQASMNDRICYLWSENLSSVACGFHSNITLFHHYDYRKKRRRVKILVTASSPAHRRYTSRRGVVHTTVRTASTWPVSWLHTATRLSVSLEFGVYFSDVTSKLSKDQFVFSSFFICEDLLWSRLVFLC